MTPATSGSVAGATTITVYPARGGQGHVAAESASV